MWFCTDCDVFLHRRVEAGIWGPYKVWSGAVLCGVWHPLHDSTLLPVQTATTVRSCFRTRWMMLISAVCKKHNNKGAHDRYLLANVWRKLQKKRSWWMLPDLHHMLWSSPETIIHDVPGSALVFFFYHCLKIRVDRRNRKTDVTLFLLNAISQQDVSKNVGYVVFIA